MSGLGGGFEGVDVGDLEGAPEESYGLRTHAGKSKKVEHGRAILCEEIIAKRHGDGGQEVPYVSSHALADAGDSEHSLWILCDFSELLGLLFDGFRSAAVGADAEGIGGVDLEEGRCFVEQACDGDIVHGEDRIARRMLSPLAMPL